MNPTRRPRRSAATARTAAPAKIAALAMTAAMPRAISAARRRATSAVRVRRRKAEARAAVAVALRPTGHGLPLAVRKPPPRRIPALPTLGRRIFNLRDRLSANRRKGVDKGKPAIRGH
jgi:hypothetical protein